MGGSLSAVPPPPREPSPRARELIFRFQGADKVFLLVGVIFTAVGLGLTIPFCWRVPSDLAIAAGGHERHGRVLSREEDRSTTINGRHPVVIRFAYSVAGTRYEAQSSTINREVMRAAAADETIPIQVSGLNPQWARVAGTTRSIFGYFGLLALIFPLLGLLIGGLAVRARRRAIRAFVYGTPATAKVVGFGPDANTRINGRNPFQVSWECRVEERIFSGSLSSMTMLALEDLGKAAELVVLYDPADPSINTAWVA